VDKEAILNEDAVIGTKKKVGFDEEEGFHQRFKKMEYQHNHYHQRKRPMQNLLLLRQNDTHIFFLFL
jgi:hypothetical protein